jgi:hypothetical protein
MLSVKDVRTDIAAKLQAAKLEFRPFPHLIVPNFFPIDVYNSILKYNLFEANAGEELVSKAVMAQMRLRQPYHLRKQINFHARPQIRAESAALEFWDQLANVFLDGDWFPKLVFSKFPEYFLLRFGEAVYDERLWDNLEKQLFLQRHDVGYYLGPHTDRSTRIFTCIFSLADREGFEQCGTQFARPKDPFVRCWGDGHHEFKDFDVVQTVPYRPNHFLLFFKTRHTFHSVKMIDESVPNSRLGMQFQYFEPVNGVFRDLSRPDLMVWDQTNWRGKAMRLRRMLAASWANK